MNIIQTFYSYADINNPIQDNAGFLSPDMNWKSMALSCLLLKKQFKEVTLYCNQRIKDLIIDKFQIPYDHIIEMPDFMDEYRGCNLWALPKIHTYSVQQEPFLHVDCDWFMFEKLSDSILESDIIGQNIEYDDQMYNHRTLEKLISNKCNIPLFVLNEYNKEPILRVINAGILGGNDIVFIQKYIQTILYFINTNKSILYKLNDGFVNSIYEQLFFYLMAKEYHKSLGLCTEGDMLSTKFDWLPMDLTYAPKYGYMHLLANLKRRMSSYVFVSQYLNHLDPELGYRITKVCYDNGISPLINFPEWHIYNSTSSIKGKTSQTNIHSIGTPILGKEITIDKMEYNLLINPQTTNTELKYNTERLWDIDTLWSSKYYFEVSNKVRISEISYKQAILHLKNGNDKIFPQLKNEETIYAVSIPDPMLMKVTTILISGIKVEIIRFLQSAKSATLFTIGTHISDKLKISLMEPNVRVAIDKTIRSMVVAGILRFTS
ncbi:MAG: hypothetical protein HUK10_00360 [Bacteroides heparinolyticus]|nr:hypothetical protein [Bacteroides heparinolyticus]